MSKQWRVEIENHDGTRSMLQIEEPTEADAAARAKRNGHRVIAVYPDTRPSTLVDRPIASLSADELQRVLAHQSARERYLNGLDARAQSRYQSKRAVIGVLLIFVIVIAIVAAIRVTAYLVQR